MFRDEWRSYGGAGGTAVTGSRVQGVGWDKMNILNKKI